MIWFIFFMLSFIKIATADINFTHRTIPYATHQPVLYEIAIQTTGPIIEFGCGDGSTDMLHEICKKNKRILISLDDSKEWLNKFKKKYLKDGYEKDNSGWHKFFFVPGKNPNARKSPAHWIKFLDNNDLIKNMYFSLCFVDQAPWLARFETIKRMKTKSRYVILHDCNYFPKFGIFGKIISPSIANGNIPGLFDFSDIFKYYKVYFPLKPWPLHTGPPTLLGSDMDTDLPEIDYSKY